MLFVCVTMSSAHTILAERATIQFPGFRLCEEDKTGLPKVDMQIAQTLKKMIDENIRTALDEIWNNRNNSNVPKCIRDLINTLSGAAVPIDVYPAYKKLGNDLVTMCVSNTSSDPYKSGHNCDGPWGGHSAGKIRLYGVWKPNIGKNKANCLKGLILHELIHYALFMQKGSPIYEHIKTSYLPKYEHEGVTEDCSRKYFPCAPAGHEIGDDGLNPPGDDCECCKVCTPPEIYCAEEK